MRLSQLWPILALAAISGQQLATPAAAHADTYSITGPGWQEGEQAFYGIDSYGNVYLHNFPSDTYTTLLRGGAINTSADLPTFIDDAGGSCSEAVPGFSYLVAGICNNNRFAYLQFQSGTSLGTIYVYSGISTPPTTIVAPFGDLIAMNSLGDIIFDNGLEDYAVEAVDLTTLPTPTPEPPAIVLLTTGMLALGVTYRRRLAPS